MILTLASRFRFLVTFIPNAKFQIVAKSKTNFLLKEVVYYNFSAIFFWNYNTASCAIFCLTSDTVIRKFKTTIIIIFSDFDTESKIKLRQANYRKESHLHDQMQENTKHF